MKCPLTVPEYVRDALANVAQKVGFISNQHSVDYDFRASENNRSVVSIFYRVTFREEPREVTVLCKVPPPDADDTLLAMFEREVFVYGKLLPAFEVFQRTKREGLPEGSAVEEEMIAFGPLCYHAHCDAKKGEGIIILEDVQRRGFTNRHKFESMDYDHARLAMMQLGRFHAVSLALKKQQPELFEQYRYMGDVTGERVLAMEEFEQAMEQAFESASATLNPGDVGRREKLARLRGSFAEELQNINDTALSEPFCVVCHGDYAGDNMMFSYNVKSIDEDTGRVIVEFTIGKQTESLNECLIQLVSIGEYSKNSNVINTAKYEQFKERERYSASAGSSKDTVAEEAYSKRSSNRDNHCTNSSDDERERQRRKHKKSSSPYIRTSSGTKKKSHKYKQRREYRDERRGSSRDRRHRSPRSSGSESDDKFHKNKKTKKKKRPRSRSRSRQ